MHHVVQLPRTDDHVDGLRLEEVERLAVLPVPLLLHLQNDRVKHTYTIYITSTVINNQSPRGARCRPGPTLSGTPPSLIASFPIRPLRSLQVGQRRWNPAFLPQFLCLD